MAIYIEVGALLIALFLLYLLMIFLKNLLLIFFNSILGIVAFFVLNAVFHIVIPLNFWSIAIVATGGLGGLLLILILHFLGLAF